jgi:hypothetical protein
MTITFFGNTAKVLSVLTIYADTGLSNVLTAKPASAD